MKIDFDLKAKYFKIFVILFLLILTALSIAHADVKVNKIFSNNMVLQRDLPVPIWGTASPFENVQVTFRQQQKSTTSDKNGKWSITLEPLTTGTGKSDTLTIKSKNTILLHDILVGEVWVGSGQSNMAGSVATFAIHDKILAKNIDARFYPNLRLYKVSATGSYPNSILPYSSWEKLTSANIKSFSALLFTFGHSLQKELNVPVGLIFSAVGGSSSGKWLNYKMLNSDPVCHTLIKNNGVTAYNLKLKNYKLKLSKWNIAKNQALLENKKPPPHPQYPLNFSEVGHFYRSHIKSIIPYAIRGVLWDQGESGTAIPGINQFNLMGALISGWRQAWGQGNFPFLYIQKYSGGGCAWDPENNLITRMADTYSVQPTKVNKNRDGLHREMYIKIMNHPNTAMVTSSDLGSKIHPLNKSGYGQRSSHVALGFVYNKNIEIYGPIYASHEIKGKNIYISYKHIGKGLSFRHGKSLYGFEILSDNGLWYWGNAKIVGNQVIVSSNEVSNPVNVRYGWSKNHTWANLFNKDGLPALTFRGKK